MLEFIISIKTRMILSSKKRCLKDLGMGSEDAVDVVERNMTWQCKLLRMINVMGALKLT
jgi:hypothetical protein